MSLINKSDKVFVAGHKGMAGRAICKSLEKHGYCNPAFGGSLITKKRIELNLLDNSEVKKFFQKERPNIVILAAAKVGGIFANKEYSGDFILENLKIQTNVIEESWRFGVKRLLFLGSSCIYPKFSKQPIVEEELMAGALEATNSAYAIAKISGIKLINCLRDQYGFDGINLMPTNLYGPGDNYHKNDSHVIASLIRKFYEAKKEGKKEVICWGTGEPLREFLHSDDLGDACVFALENWDPVDINSPKNNKGETLNLLNVGSGKDITIRELAEKIAKITEFKGKIIWDKSMPDGTPRKLIDVSRLKSMGWESKISLEDGLTKTIREFSNLYSKSCLRL